MLKVGSCTPNVVERFKMTFLFIDPDAFAPAIPSASVSFASNADTFGTDFKVPSVFGTPLGDNLCLIGLFNIDFHVTAQTYLRFVVSTPSITSLSVCTNFDVYNYDIECFALCPIGTTRGTASSYDCVSCGSAIANCANCSSLTTCTNCQTYAYPSGPSCLLCNGTFPHCSECYSSSSCAGC